MKAHIGVDEASGYVHSLEITAANVADATQAEKLLHCKECQVHADAGYIGADKRVQHKGLKWSIAERRSNQKALPEGIAQAAWRELERRKAQVRARVELRSRW